MFPEIPNKQPIIIESATLDTFTNSYWYKNKFTSFYTKNKFKAGPGHNSMVMWFFKLSSKNY